MARVLGRFVFLSLFFFAVNACADVLALKNGRKIEGIIKHEDNTAVELEVYGGTIKIRNSEIANITRSNSSQDVLMRQDWQEQKNVQEERLKLNKLEEERKPKEVEFLDENESVMVKAQLNGNVNVNLVLDTGSSAVMLKRPIAEKLGIKPEALRDAQVTLANGKTVPAKHFILKSVKVQDSVAANVDAVILMEEEGSLGPVDGLLGMSFFKQFSFKIDRKAKKLTLEKL